MRHEAPGPCARIPADAPRRVRHRPRELRVVVLPSHGARGDRGRAHARLRPQCRDARHPRRDLLLRLHAAADPGRRARGHTWARRILTAGSVIAGVGVARVCARANMGGGGGGAHAGRRRRLRRVHRHPQDQRRLVSGQSLRDAERRHDVRRQCGRRDRGRAAGVGRHADIVAQRVRRPCRAVAGTWPRNVAAGARHAAGIGVSTSECARTGNVRDRALDARAARCPGQSRDVAGLFRQRRHRRQLSCLRGFVGSTVPCRKIRHVTRERRRAREPAAARRRVRFAGHRPAVRPPGASPHPDACVRAALCAVVAAVAAARPMAILRYAGLGLPDGPAHPRVHVVVDGSQGGEPARAFRNGDLRGQPRHLPRRWNPAAARGLGARSRPWRRHAGVGPRAVAARRQRSARRSGKLAGARKTQSGVR